MVGFFHTPALGSVNGYTDELLIGYYHAADTSSECLFYVTSWQFANTVATVARNDVYVNTSVSRTWQGYGYIMTGGFTRAGTDSTVINPGVWALAVYVPTLPNLYGAFSGVPSVQLYPDPTGAPGEGAAGYLSYQLNVGTNSGGVIPAQVLVHQNRIVQLCQILQLWPRPVGVYQQFAANEVFNYTDPPNSLNLTPPQDEVFVQEHPSGYAGVGRSRPPSCSWSRTRAAGWSSRGTSTPRRSPPCPASSPPTT